ncbi:hypothetical protein MNEG_13128 [Monoraphidium neglectum]|uniref:Uncharacterized protein n=1 Tax=Monoraphidium neglectum TaxID=145388 RepID=A0A0D2KG39_9CHLO|nr:hypothetical protein MNEG_13128 [Monoraphidium neglectum]KIY94833.1 hypothetical protein MNEG_13128 [Monoraphidium neglectum]|eukprot:XP_013893853.1 hypothetical protein MNEG_13128 [Monoraphidium neglectum]
MALCALNFGAKMEHRRIPAGGTGGGAGGGGGSGGAGGAAAFAKKGSTKSLTAAGGSALILALAARTMVGSGAKGAIAVALAVSVLLTLVMSRRYQASRKFMPAGLTAATSLLISAAYIGALT